MVRVDGQEDLKKRSELWPFARMYVQQTPGFICYAFLIPATVIERERHVRFG